METFAIVNFGCRASQADGAALSVRLQESGRIQIAETEKAAIVVFNTCTVTAAADVEADRAIRRVHRLNPEAKIVVTGCYAQRSPETVAGLPGVTTVIGNGHKAEIALLCSEPFHGQVHADALPGDGAVDFLPSAAAGRARPHLKIQDGCSHVCSYCVIPSVRGRSRSVAPDGIVEAVRALCGAHAEIVLTGINLGRWGREAGGRMRLADLLRRLLDETGVQRIRLSSVEPMDWSEDLLMLMASTPRLAKHVHAPLQSGSAAVLRRMRRRYRPEHYEGRMRRALELMPDAALGADTMAGYPGETEEEFEETCRFIEKIPFAYLHVFPYSERPGTEAASAGSPVPWPVRKDRVRRLTALSLEKNRAFRERMKGRDLSSVVLLDGTAVTTNHIRVQLEQQRVPQTLLDLRMGGLTESGMREFTLLPIFETQGSNVPVLNSDCACP